MNVDAWYQLGLQALKAEQLAEAEVAFNAVVKAKPRHTGALYRLGEVSERRGLRPDAAWFYMRTLQIEPGHVSARRQLGRLQSAYTDEESASARIQPVAPGPSRSQTDFFLPSTEEEFDNYRRRITRKKQIEIGANWHSLPWAVQIVYAVLMSGFLIAFFTVLASMLSSW